MVSRSLAGGVGRPRVVAGLWSEGTLAVEAPKHLIGGHVVESEPRPSFAPQPSVMLRGDGQQNRRTNNVGLDEL